MRLWRRRGTYKTVVFWAVRRNMFVGTKWWRERDTNKWWLWISILDAVNARCATAAPKPVELNRGETRERERGEHAKPYALSLWCFHVIHSAAWTHTEWHSRKILEKAVFSRSTAMHRSKRHSCRKRKRSKRKRRLEANCMTVRNELLANLWCVVVIVFSFLFSCSFPFGCEELLTVDGMWWIDD